MKLPKWLFWLVIPVLVLPIGLVVLYRSASNHLDTDAALVQVNNIQVKVASRGAFSSERVVSGDSKNAATLYFAAVKSYAERRTPFLKNRKLNPFANEPAISMSELKNLVDASLVLQCNFQSAIGSGISIGKKVIDWKNPAGNGLFSDRTYVPLMRLVAQAALNEGKLEERRGGLVAAEQIYQAIYLLGTRLMEGAVSLMDEQFGIELQRRSLHYLDYYFGLIKFSAKRAMVWQTGDYLKKIESEIRAKFRTLDQPADALAIIRKDPDPIWRAEAAMALRASIVYHRIGWPLSSVILSRLTSAANDSDPSSSEFARQALDVPTSVLHKVGSEQNRANSKKGAGS